MKYFLLSGETAGHLLQDSASLLQPREGGEGESANEGRQTDGSQGSLLTSATRSLLCIIQQEDCQSNVRTGRKTQSRVKERIDDNVAHGIFHITLDLGAQILSAATNILTDIAFIKIKILQGFFSNPDCWESPKNDNNGCISKLCNDTEQRQKIYIDNFGQCLGQARKWIIDVTQSQH